jgi:hypothetical protein
MFHVEHPFYAVVLNFLNESDRRGCELFHVERFLVDEQGLRSPIVSCGTIQPHYLTILPQLRVVPRETSCM